MYRRTIKNRHLKPINPLLRVPQVCRGYVSRTFDPWGAIYVMLNGTSKRVAVGGTPSQPIPLRRKYR